MPVNKVQIHLPYERPSEKNPNGIFQPRWYQLEALESPCRYKILVLPRRAGKSKTALVEQIMQTYTLEKTGKISVFLAGRDIYWLGLVGLQTVLVSRF